MKCGIVEKHTRTHKDKPPCPHELVNNMCPVHCRAKLRGERKGRLCSNHHLKGRRGCRMHLGKRKRGMAHHNFKSGAYSRYIEVLDPETAKRYKKIEASPDFLSLAPDIVMIQTRIDELIARAKSGETMKAWKDARTSFAAFMDAQRRGDQPAGVVALTELNQALDAGNKAREAWEEVQRLWPQLQRLVESQRRRAIEHGELVQLSIVINMLRLSAGSVRSALFDADIKSTVRDEILERVDADLARVTGGAISSNAAPRRIGNGKAKPDGSAVDSASGK